MNKNTLSDVRSELNYLERSICKLKIILLSEIGSLSNRQEQRRALVHIENVHPKKTF